MFNLKMVDTAGGGIRKMFNFQKERYFPMPEYDLSSGKVKVVITGKVLNMEYARLLARNKDLTLNDIILLDKLQKKKSLSDTEITHLKKSGLAEGRKPNYYISAKVAQQTGQKADYIKNKGLDKSFYMQLILEAIRKHGDMERKNIDDLLYTKLPDWMSEKQKANKINNLLSELRRNGQISNAGSLKKSKWIIKK
jgi:ATP-dependent DNA helicase RecG